jgi:hypothetical protein
MFAERALENFLSDLDRPDEVQARYLGERILAPNVASEFGVRHGFKELRGIEDYQRAVPIRDYEAFRSDVDRLIAGEPNVLTTDPIKRFFLTSGSTSLPKHVPVTQALIRDKSRAFGIYWSAVFRDHPRVKTGGIVTNFSDSGRAAETRSGLLAGSESAYWAEVTRATARREPLIPKDVARIADPEERYRAIAETLRPARFAAIMALNPSTLLALFRVLDRPAKELWPELELAISWRSPMLAPYLRLLEPHLAGIAARDYLSMASEGVLAIPLRDGESGGVLAIGVHFYEFIPEEQYERASPDVLLPHQLEAGRQYVVVLSNASGLYRYDIGDVVRVLRFEQRTPVIEFQYRVGRTCSFTGEKLTEAQVSAAAGDASAELGVAVHAFTLIPVLDVGLPHYRWLVEVGDGVDLAALLRSLETKLCAHNTEYAGKRTSLRLGAPELWRVANGGYAALRRRRVEAGANEDQLKETHLTRDATFWKAFEIRERIGAD